jgi:hypothetical protein
LKILEKLHKNLHHPLNEYLKSKEQINETFKKQTKEQWNNDIDFEKHGNSPEKKMNEAIEESKENNVKTVSYY